MTVTPEDDPHNYHDSYWRCGRNGGCGQKAGWGTDHVGVGACKLHGGNNPRGKANGNYKHGGYSKYLSPEQFTDDEIDRAEAIYEDLQDVEGAQDVGRSFAMDLLIRWDRTKDTRYAREFRQFCETFGFAPEDIRKLMVEHSGSVDHEHEHTLSPRQQAHLDALTDGPADVDIELVDEVPTTDE